MKIIEFRNGILLVLIAAVMSSCYYDEVIKVEENIEVGEVTFSVDIIPIFTESCAVSGCHNGNVSPNLLPANAYNTLINGNYVNVNDPKNSELYLWVSGKKTLPMPPTGSDATINANVLAWIEQGALNN